MGNPARFIGAALAATAIVFAASAGAQEAKRYRFAYDQPRNTGYSVAGDLFADKLKELSKGTMLIDQYPGAQLGQEPQLLQLVKAGDIDFAIISSANTATISPQAGVMSLHFLFRDENHVIKGLADPKVFEALKTMIDETTQGLHVIATGSQGVRHMYSKKEIRNVGDIKGLKIRVQATATEDLMFPAYGAQTVHRLVVRRLAWHDGYTRRGDEPPRVDLRSHLCDDRSRRPHECQTGPDACVGKRGVLGEKSITGMDRVRRRAARRLEQPRN